MPTFVYQIPPIDWWDGFVPLAQALRPDAGDQSDCDFNRRLLERLALGHAAAAMHLDWEGDTKEGPYVFAVPDGESSGGELAVAWKQENNGDTFIVSPNRLLHVERGAYWEMVEVADQPGRWRVASARLLSRATIGA
jgi:hypothetical protein